MKIRYYVMQGGTPMDKMIYDQLLRAQLYEEYGVLKCVWRDGADDPYAPKYRGHLAVAYNDNKPIGVAYLSRKDFYGWEDYRRKEIQDAYGFVGVYVKEQYRKQGIGKELLNLVLRRSRVKKVAIMEYITHMVETDTELVAFY